MQVGPEPDPTRDYTQHHHISLGGTREGPWAAQEASPWPRRWSDSSWVPNREEYFLRLEIIAPPLSSLRMRTLSGGARHFVEKQHLREDPIPPPHLQAFW